MRGVRPPSVDSVAQLLAGNESLADLPRPLLVAAARTGIACDPANAEAAAITEAQVLKNRLIQPVINATGVLLHTNLGRAPQPPLDSRSAVRYNNVEFDLATGQRGSRRTSVEGLLRQITGAEGVLVVNNCAAAVMLALAAIAKTGGVAVSRGELVEIGGGFRIPDVLEQSGAALVEVGTTNRTRVGDYAHAIDRSVASDRPIGMLLKVHQSNYKIVGFTEEATIDELATLGKSRGIAVVADIGSGLLDANLPWLADKSGRVPELPWLANEPAVRQTLAAGADVAIFSGDKLLGGPQAGILVGRADLIEACAKHPLARAVRPGSGVLQALQSTLLAYMRRDLTQLPFWNMAVTPLDELRRRAENIVEAVSLVLDGSTLDGSALDGSALDTAEPATAAGNGNVWVVDTQSVAGGGTLPGQSFSSVGVALKGNKVPRLRRTSPPIIARSTDGLTTLDLRTVDPSDDPIIISALIDSISRTHPQP